MTFCDSSRTGKGCGPSVPDLALRFAPSSSRPWWHDSSTHVCQPSTVQSFQPGLPASESKLHLCVFGFNLSAASNLRGWAVQMLQLQTQLIALQMRLLCGMYAVQYCSGGHMLQLHEAMCIFHVLQDHQFVTFYSQC